MNKLQAIEFVQNKLGGGSATDEIKAKYRDGVVRLHLGIVFDDLILRVYQNSLNANISDLDAYTKVYDVIAFLPADTTGMKYVEIPGTTGKLLQIPNNKAIRKIWTIEFVTVPPTDSRKCLYREIGMEDVYSQLEANNYLTQPRYSIMGNRIYFDSKIGTATGAKIWKISPFAEFTDTEDLPAPLENDKTWIEEIYMSLLNQPPQDKISDENVVQS